MIFDNISGCEKYTANDNLLARAFDFIKTAVSENYEIGRYEILPDGEMYAVVQEYISKSEEECSFEGHRKYIDVQFVISGAEKIDIADISRAESKIDYDADKDVEFFDCRGAVTSLAVQDGDFGVFYPNDIHKPGMTLEKKTQVRKIVVKIKA